MSPALEPDEEALQAAEELHHRHISDAQRHTFESYMAEIFTTLGLDLNTPSTKDTPRRYIQALIDVTAGYEGDPKLLTVFETECRGEPDCRLSQVIEGPVPFYAICEHHALPIVGEVYLGYVSHEHIIGISKLTRLVRLFARRFTVQERLGRQIADTLVEILQPHGVAVYIRARHLCTRMRGVRERASFTRTTHWRGVYEHDPALRTEFFVSSGLEQ